MGSSCEEVVGRPVGAVDKLGYSVTLYVELQKPEVQGKTVDLEELRRDVKAGNDHENVFRFGELIGTSMQWK
jgi:hypothetical protein